MESLESMCSRMSRSYLDAVESAAYCYSCSVVWSCVSVKTEYNRESYNGWTDEAVISGVVLWTLVGPVKKLFYTRAQSPHIKEHFYIHQHLHQLMYSTYSTLFPR